MERETDAESATEAATARLTEIDGIGPVTARNLAEHYNEGCETGHRIIYGISRSAATSWMDLTAVDGISETRARDLFDQMREAGVYLDPSEVIPPEYEEPGVDEADTDVIDAFEVAVDDIETPAYVHYEGHLPAFCDEDNTISILDGVGFPDPDGPLFGEFDTRPTDTYMARVTDDTGADQPADLLVIESEPVHGSARHAPTFLSEQNARVIETMADHVPVGDIRLCDRRDPNGVFPVIVELPGSSYTLLAAPYIPPGLNQGFGGLPDKNVNIERHDDPYVPLIEERIESTNPEVRQ